MWAKLIARTVGAVMAVALTVPAVWAQQADRPTIVLGTGIAPPLVDAEDGTPGFLEEVATEAFARAGYDLKIVILPAERVLVNANQGIEDGNLFRIAGLTKAYPNLIQVPEKFFESEFVGYVRGTPPNVTDWSGLAPFEVGYINGWKIFENNVTAARDVVKVRSADQLFGLLANDRADIVLYERWQGLWLARKMGLADVTAIEPPFVTMDMFMYLHKKHIALVPDVAAALKEMKADGTYRAIFERTLGALADRTGPGG